MCQLPIKSEEGTDLGHVLRVVIGFNAARTDGRGEVLGRKVTGDFVVQVGVEPEKLAAALETILRKDCGLAVSVKVEEDERVVHVLSGKYAAQPLPGRKDIQIEIYGTELGDRTTGGGASGTLAELCNHVEGFIEEPVILEEVTGTPKVIEWHYNSRSPATKRQVAEDHDADAVTRNIAAQTGLSVNLERRRIKILVVEEDK